MGQTIYLSMDPNSENKVLDYNEITYGESIPGFRIGMYQANADTIDVFYGKNQSPNIIIDGNGWTIMNMIVDEYLIHTTNHVVLKNFNILNFTHRNPDGALFIHPIHLYKVNIAGKTNGKGFFLSRFNTSETRSEFVWNECDFKVQCCAINIKHHGTKNYFRLYDINRPYSQYSGDTSIENPMLWQYNNIKITMCDRVCDSTTMPASPSDVDYEDIQYVSFFGDNVMRDNVIKLIVKAKPSTTTVAVNIFNIGIHSKVYTNVITCDMLNNSSEFSNEGIHYGTMDRSSITPSSSANEVILFINKNNNSLSCRYNANIRKYIHTPLTSGSTLKLITEDDLDDTEYLSSLGYPVIVREEDE
jgi:hypothetical protein